MIVKDVIQQFRVWMRDTEKTRYPENDSTAMQYFRNALSALWNSRRGRPMFYVARVVNQKPSVAKETDALELLDDALPLLAHHMCYEALQEDSEDAQNLALANSHFAQFNG